MMLFSFSLIFFKEVGAAGYFVRNIFSKHKQWKNYEDNVSYG